MKRALGVAVACSLLCGPALAQLASEAALAPVAAARLPLLSAENSKLHIFRPDNGEAEHYAIEIGAPHRDQPVLVGAST